MMDYISKLPATSLVFQKYDLLVCSINCIIESCIDVFKVMKTQPGKIYKYLPEISRKMVISCTKQPNSTNHQVDLEVLMTSTQLNITKKPRIRSLPKSSVVPRPFWWSFQWSQNFTTVLANHIWFQSLALIIQQKLNVWIQRNWKFSQILFRT